MQQIKSFYSTRTHPNDTFTVELQEFSEDDGWQAIDDTDYPSAGDAVSTPKGYSNSVKGAEQHAKKAFSISEAVPVTGN